MARPLKEGLDYFPHDTDAFNDEKIEALRFKHDAMGYMFYFFHLERIYRASNAELIVSDAETKQIFARKLSITEQEYDNILKTCLKYNCFDAEKYEKYGVLTSNGIQKRVATVVDKRNKMRHLYQEKVSDAETPPETNQKLHKNLSETRQSKVNININKSINKSKDIFPLESEERKLSTLLYGLILKRRANFKKPNLDNWGKEISKMIRIDKRDIVEIEKVINWCQSDSFWQNNILSADKFRKQYDQLALKMEDKYNGQAGRGKQPLACEKETPEGKYANIPTEIIDNTL